MADLEKEFSDLLSSAGLIFVGGVFGSLSKLVERIVIARSISVDAYGDVSVALAVTTLSVTLATIGFTQGIPRYMSRFDEESNVRGAWITGFVVAGSFALIITSVLFFQLDLLAEFLLDLPEARQLLLPFILGIPLIVSFKIGISGIRGLENTVYRTYARDLFYPLLRILLVGGLLVLGFGVVAVGYAHLLAAAAAAMLTYFLLNKLFSFKGPYRLHSKEMLLFSGPLVVSSVLSVLLMRTDTMMLGYFRPSYEVGLYSSAFPLAGSMIVILASFGYLYLPLASRLDAKTERAELDTIYKLTTKWIYIIAFPVFLTFVTFPSDVLTIFFGSRYAQGWPALVILAIGFFTNAAGGRNRETLSALGHTTHIMAVNSLAFALNISLNFVLIPVFGFIGAAVASAVSYGTINILAYLVLRSKSGITPFSRWSIRTFLVLPISLIPPVLFMSSRISLGATTLPFFLLGVAVMTILTVCLTGCLQPEDRFALEHIEGLSGVKIPYIRSYLPDT